MKKNILIISSLTFLATNIVASEVSRVPVLQFCPQSLTCVTADNRDCAMSRRGTLSPSDFWMVKPLSVPRRQDTFYVFDSVDNITNNIATCHYHGANHNESATVTSFHMPNIIDGTGWIPVTGHPTWYGCAAYDTDSLNCPMTF